MPIEKIKRTQKPMKRKVTEKVTAAPDLEKKRAAFKQAVEHRKKATTPKSHTARNRTVIIAVAAVLVALGSTVVAFAYHWYQGPEATVMQSIVNATNAQSASYTGSLSIRGVKPSSLDGSYQPGKSAVNATISTPLPGDLSTLKLSLLSANQNMYAKLNNASDLAIQTAPPDQQPIYKSIISKYANQIDNKWISISKDEIGSFSSVTGISQCMIDIFENFTTNSSSRQALATLYAKHSFMTITTKNDTADGAGMYRLQIQPAAFDAFMDALYGSEYFASLAGCSKQNDSMKSSDLAGFYIDLTIDKSQRQIKEAHIYTGDKTLATVIVSPKFGDIKTITEPSDAFSLDTIKSAIVKQLFVPSN